MRPKRGPAALAGAAFSARATDNLVSEAAAWLLKNPLVDTERTSQYIHPSEMAKAQWCHRATYYRISGEPALTTPNSVSQEVVFNHGNQAHHFWQTLYWRMGRLQGNWQCRWCRTVWEGVSPTVCPRCEAGVDMLVYREVPLHNEEYLIDGHADGDVISRDGKTSSLIEIKTVGAGSVRYDAPALLEKYAFTGTLTAGGGAVTGVNWDKLWRDLKRPFPSHFRQGMLYCFLKERPSIVFIYEPKMVSGYPKAFDVKFDFSYVEPLLAKCLVVKDRLQKGVPPKRPVWATPSCTTCRDCPYTKVCYGNR